MLFGGSPCMCLHLVIALCYTNPGSQHTDVHMANIFSEKRENTGESEYDCKNVLLEEY